LEILLFPGCTWKVCREKYAAKWILLFMHTVYPYI
jgi:hypothetical protein